jgi:2-phospho-L-lactate guanylyltransferase
VSSVPPVSTTAILPVKGSANAKARLGGALSGAERRQLAEAMFRDVLDTLLASPRVNRLLVVAASGSAARIAAERDVPVLRDAERGHNAAARIGIEAALGAGAERVLLVPGDCPLLDPHELDELLGRPAPGASALVVPDRHGTGTNALLLRPPDALAPAFGPGSRERHLAGARAAGLHAEVVQVPSLATDVDTPEDLEALERLLASANGVAAHTRRWLSALACR